MTALGVLLLMIQIGFAIHVIRTGRETYWLFIIILIPALGCLVYFLTQVAPELGSSRTARNARRSVIKTIDPQRELRRTQDQLSISDTIENRVNYAEQCIESGRYTEARALLASCLNGAHEHDPGIMLLLASAQFHEQDYAEAKGTLDRLIAHNPGFRSHEGHLLYARSLEELGQLDQALEEYSALATSYPGEQGRVRYALLLKKLGKPDEAQAVFRESLTRAKQAPAYYRKKEREWLDIARQHA